jgi:hypothetical protein
MASIIRSGDKLANPSAGVVAALFSGISVILFILLQGKQPDMDVL